MAHRGIGAAPAHHHRPQPIEHLSPRPDGERRRLAHDFGILHRNQALLWLALLLRLRKRLLLSGLPHRDGPQAAWRGTRTGNPAASNAAFTCAMVNVPKWNTLAASSPVAPARAPSTKCSNVPTPPEAITGTRTHFPTLCS